MERATITEVKNGLSAIIDRVKAGESILVTDRGIAVAVIEPVTTQVDLDERFARLERAGLLRRGTGQIPRSILETPGPALPDGVDMVAYVLEDREAGW
jgi:prevent-host-death family protein